MKKRRLVIMGLFAIGTVLVLCSCGGGSSGNNGKRLTKEQFATKANAICLSFNKANSATGTPRTRVPATRSPRDFRGSRRGVPRAPAYRTSYA